MAMHRRSLFRIGALGAVGILATNVRRWIAADEETFDVVRNDDEWRRVLTSNQYAVLRGAATEPPYSSPLNAEHRAGVFRCAGCEQQLFSSAAKFDSDTGWPSFWQPLPGAVGARLDASHGMLRTEVHCSRCGGHLGHVFDDGPKPTGLRYCLNGLALAFMPVDDA